MLYLSDSLWTVCETTRVTNTTAIAHTNHCSVVFCGIIFHPLTPNVKQVINIFVTLDRKNINSEHDNRNFCTRPLILSSEKE